MVNNRNLVAVAAIVRMLAYHGNEMSKDERFAMCEAVETLLGLKN